MEKNTMAKKIKKWWLSTIEQLLQPTKIKIKTRIDKKPFELNKFGVALATTTQI